MPPEVVGSLLAMSSASSTSTFLAPLTGASTSPDGLAVPRDFGARRGDGLHLGLSLGGGGIFFVAWQVTYLRELLTRLGAAQPARQGHLIDPPAIEPDDR